jgi:formylglycine-generating enzyme required for sulfatase activity
MICPAVLLALPLLVPAAREDTKKPPFRDREAALKLFAEEFVSITPGKGMFPASFKMGSTGEAPKEEKPAHEVTLKKPFAIAKYEVTQELYAALMGKNPAMWKGPRNSVEMVSWKEAVEFCKRATAEMRRAKLIGEDEEIRLPSEAEWEYCCRAGTKTPFSFGEEKDIRAHSWYRDNSKGFDPPVGEKKPSTWGLHEMHGYVWEWCADSWHASYEGAPADASKGAPTDGSAWRDEDAKEYVIRGGAFNSPADRCRSAAREPRGVDYRKDDLGFRCVRATIK